MQCIHIGVEDCRIFRADFEWIDSSLSTIEWRLWSCTLYYINKLHKSLLEFWGNMLYIQYIFRARDRSGQRKVNLVKIVTF